MENSLPIAPKVIAFTDGSVNINNANVLSMGSAGVAFVTIRIQDSIPMIDRIRVCTEYAVGYSNVTSARMELAAFSILASASVLFFNDGEDRIIPAWSDSEYALNILFNSKWGAKKNEDLISMIKRALTDNSVTVIGRHIRGHQGYFFNELVDYACSQTWKNGVAIDKDVPVGDIPLGCSLCKFFPCVNGNRANKKRWTDAFRLIKTGSWSVCDRRSVYADLQGSTQLVGPR